MEDKEKKNESGSNSPKEETKSRREFLRSAAIQGAVAALFGAVTFDAVMARAMERVGDIQSANAIGSNAVNRLTRYAVAPQSTSCPTYICYKPVYACDGSSTQKCSPDYNCGGGGQLYSCYNQEFDCYQFTCFDFSCKANGFEGGIQPPKCETDGFTCSVFSSPC